MFAVFDVIRKLGIDAVVSEIKVLKLVRGGEVLVSNYSGIQFPIDYSLTSTIIKEQVVFSDLQDQVRMDEERASSQNIPDALLRVIVIVKRPLLALRYTLPDGQIRKTQMNFMPFSGCDVALETLRAAGLPIRDKDLPQLQDQRPHSVPSLPRTQERPGFLEAGQPALSQSSQDAFPDSLQPLSQDRARVLKAGSTSIASALRPTKCSARPTSAPGGVNQDEFSRPISASSRSSLNAFRSTAAVATTPAVAKPGTPSGLLPSPVFNGTYDPFGSVEVRPMSVSEPTQTQEDYANTLTVSQMLPPERTLSFPEKTAPPIRRDEVSSQENMSQQRPAPKMVVRRQTKPRAQQANPTKPRAKRRATNTSSMPIAPSSPSPGSPKKEKVPSSSAPPNARAKSIALPDNVVPKVARPEVQATPPSPPNDSRKRSLTDRTVHRPNKRQAQSSDDTTRENSLEAFTAVVPDQQRKAQSRDSTTRENTPETLPTAVPEQPLPEQPPQGTDGHFVIRKDCVQCSEDTTRENTPEALPTAVPKQLLPEQLPQGIDPRFIIRNHDLLDTIDNFIRKYHDLPAPKPSLQTAKEQLAEYAAQSEEDRARALDDMICTCLEDESFGTLMEDIEKAWKGVGLRLWGERGGNEQKE